MTGDSRSQPLQGWGENFISFVEIREIRIIRSSRMFLLHVGGGGLLVAEELLLVEGEEVVVEEMGEAHEHGGVEGGLVEDAVHVDAGAAVFLGEPRDGSPSLVHDALYLLAYVHWSWIFGL